MLAGLLPVYVDRFARVWHRLSTTDTPGLRFHYKQALCSRQAPVKQVFKYLQSKLN